MAEYSSGAGSHLIGLMRSTIPPIHPGGRPIILTAAAVTVGARFALRAVGLKRAGSAVGRVGTLATLGSAAFFRAPRRVPPTDQTLVVVTEKGELLLGPATPTAFKPTGRGQILGAVTRAFPALAGGRLYARDGKNLVAVDLTVP